MAALLLRGVISSAAGVMRRGGNSHTVTAAVRGASVRAGSRPQLLRSSRSASFSSSSSFRPLSSNSLLSAGGLVLGGGVAAMVVLLGTEGERDAALSYNAYKIPIHNEDFPVVVPVFIEVAKGSRMKYEWDASIGMLRLDRVLHSAVFYPHDYGFIPQTLCDDGDPLDVLVIGDSPLEPGCIVDVRVVGYMVMEDEKGRDEKVLGVLTKDPRFADVQTLRDLNDHLLREISQFFESYKVLEREKWVKVGGWLGHTDTYDLVERTHKAYKEAEAKDAATTTTTPPASSAPTTTTTTGGDKKQQKKK